MKAVGKRYGSRVVIEVINTVKCRVRCDCGDESEVFSASLKYTAGCRSCSRPKLYLKKGNTYIVDGDTTKIVFDNGLVGLVDTADIPLIREHTWCTLKIDSCVYARTSINTGRGNKHKGVNMHKLLLKDKTLNGEFIDHINHNGLDNRRSNLRPVNHSENMSNSRRVSKNKSSKYKGVHFRKRDGKWVARICKNKLPVILGAFTCEHEAAAAYNEAATRMHGAFATLNLIDDKVMT